MFHLLISAEGSIAIGAMRVEPAQRAPRLTSQAQAFAERLRPMLTELDGLSLRTVARELERRGIATVRGGRGRPALCRPRENAWPVSDDLSSARSNGFACRFRPQ